MIPKKNLRVWLVILVLLWPACGGEENSETPPTISDDFASETTLWEQQIRSPGGITFGVSNSEAEDGLSVKIVLQGNAGLGVEDYASPPSANQISTQTRLSFGTYRARVRAAACSGAEEEVITGVFVYSNDGEDTNGNGMIDNNEIDIEVACTLPEVLWLTIWTDYTDDSNFRKITRRVDMTTGNVQQTSPGEEGEWGVGNDLGNLLSALPGFSTTSEFYEMGFDWSSDRVRFFVVVDDGEITLWTYENSSFIPQNPASFMLNVWHSSGRWDEDDAEGDYPQEDATLEADWFRYWTDS